MTHQQILWAIDAAALLAAESALDAFGSDPASKLPSAEAAWDFLHENVYIEGGIRRPELCPNSFLASSSTTTVAICGTSQTSAPALKCCSTPGVHTFLPETVLSTKYKYRFR